MKTCEIYLHIWFQVEMEIPSGFNLKGSTDILVGTIPFRNTFAQMRPHFPEPSSIPSSYPEFTPGNLPSAPPLSIAGYPDLRMRNQLKNQHLSIEFYALICIWFLAPPSYQDAFSGELPTYAEACGDEADGGGGDGDKKETPYDPNFVPKYATYGWMATAPPRTWLWEHHLMLASSTSFCNF